MFLHLICEVFLAKNQEILKLEKFNMMKKQSILKKKRFHLKKHFY